MEVDKPTKTSTWRKILRIIFGIIGAVLIFGLLVGSFGHSHYRTVDSARRETTITKIENIRAALDLFRLHNSRYPTTEQGLKGLIKKPIVGTITDNWKGPYLRRIPTDGWENEFAYRSDGSEFEIISFGADLIQGGEDVNADISSKNLQAGADQYAH